MKAIGLVVLTERKIKIFLYRDRGKAIGLLYYCIYRKGRKAVFRIFQFCAKQPIIYEYTKNFKLLCARSQMEIWLKIHVG